MLTIKRRRTFSFAGTFYTNYVEEDHPDNVPFNLTGGTARAQIREKKRGTGTTESTLIASLPVTIPSPTNGVLMINLSRAQTKALPNKSPDEIEWDLVFTDASGTDYTLVPTQPAQIITPPTNPIEAP